MSIKILIIDDDKEFALSVTRFFKEKGITVLIADNSGTGNDLLEREKPDLLIINVILNSKPLGLHFVSAFKSDRKNKSFPVIMLGRTKHLLGMNLEEVFADERFNPNVSFFAKPIEIGVLYNEFSKLLNLKLD